MYELLQFVDHQVHFCVLEFIARETEVEFFISLLYQTFQSSDKAVSLGIVEAEVKAKTF